MIEFEIDLRGISGYIEREEEKTIHQEFRKHKMFSKEFLYTVFNWNRRRQLKETGNYREKNPDTIFALTKEELIWDAEQPWHRNYLKQLTNNYEYPGIAVYDRKQFTQNPNICSPFEYSFKEPLRKTDALVGIAKLLI